MLGELSRPLVLKTCSVLEHSGEYTVEDLAEMLGMSTSAVEQHIARLRA